MATITRKTDRKVLTEEDLMEMLNLIKKGLSYSAVAKQIGTTKNAVSGHVYRIKHRGMIVRKPRKVEIHKPRATKMKNIISLDMPQTPLELTIFELKNTSCRYMIGNHKYCGCGVFEQSYCQHHFIQCHDLSRSKKWKHLIK